MIKYILIAALAARVILINQSFWLDEAISAITASKQFPNQWFGIGNDFQPPLYYLLLHFYMRISPADEWILRIPSVAFGLATVYLVYHFAKKLFDEKTAVISSLFLALSQFHVFYSQELRMYSLLCLLSLASMWLFNRQKWLFFSLVNIMGMYTSYMFMFIFLPQIIWMIYKNWGQKIVLAKWLASLIISFLFFLPWLPTLTRQYVYSRNLVTEIPAWKNVSSPPIWKIAPQTFIKFSLGRVNFNNKFLYGWIFGLLILIYGYIFLALRKNLSDASLFVLNWLITPLVAGILLSFFIPIAGVWRLIFLLPPFYLLVSFGITKLKYSKTVILILVFVHLASLGLYWMFPKYQREQWRQAVKYTNQTDNPVIFTVQGGFAPYSWYQKKEKKACGPPDLSDCLENRGVYFISYLQDFFDQNKSIQDKINLAGFHFAEVKDFPGVGFVYFYENSN